MSSLDSEEVEEGVVVMVETVIHVAVMAGVGMAVMVAEAVVAVVAVVAMGMVDVARGEAYQIVLPKTFCSKNSKSNGSSCF